MNKIFTIVKYEYKMQIKSISTWSILFIASVITLLDNFPSQKNLQRLEFLIDPTYFIYRIITLTGLILIFGLMFLQSNRILIDNKTQMKSLLETLPINKFHYVLGKLGSGFLYTATMLIIFLLLNTTIYAVFVPNQFSVLEYSIPMLKTIIILVLPVSLFISICSIGLPPIIDIRIFYVVFSILFIVNAMMVGSAESMPFYTILSGDLSKLIWQHPKFPFINMLSVLQNLLFLLITPITTIIILLINKNVWRTDE